jgi:uncharacterized protein YjbI with pentapeptide repeats
MSKISKTPKRQVFLRYGFTTFRVLLSSTPFCFSVDVVCTSSTTFRNANLSNTDLSGANLRGADGLAQEQVEEANGDEETQLPANLETPDSWK